MYMYMQRKDSSISSFWHDNNKGLEYTDTGYLWEMNSTTRKVEYPESGVTHFSAIANSHKFKQIQMENVDTVHFSQNANISGTGSF